METTRRLGGALLVLSVVAVAAGCAKRPDAEVAAARTAVEEARAAGGPQYVPEAFKGVEDALQKAQEETKAQDDRFALMRSYDKAKELLARVKSDAEKVRTEAVAAKERAKGEAEAAQKEARTSLDAAKALLAKAPRGKGTKADLEAMEADLKAAETALAEARAAADKEDYLGAKAKAQSVKDKATAVSAQVQQARAKTAKAKKP